MNKNEVANSKEIANYNEVNKRMLFILGNDASRFSIDIDEDGTPVIKVDYHQLKVAEGKRLLQNTIAMLRQSCRIEIIHGFNRGTDMKAMIYQTKNNRIEHIYSPNYNPGVTFIDLAPVC